MTMSDKIVAAIEKIGRSSSTIEIADHLRAEVGRIRTEVNRMVTKKVIYADYFVTAKCRRTGYYAVGKAPDGHVAKHIPQAELDLAAPVAQRYASVWHYAAGLVY